jgi:hypothetical protein
MATIANLVVNVTANTIQLQQAFQQINTHTNTLNQSFGSLGTKAVATGNIIATAFTSAVKYAGEAVGFLWNKMGEAIAVSDKYNSAMVGLIGVSRAFGISSESAMAAAQSLSKDGLLPIGDSAAGLKNLLMTGFGLKEATDIMNAFKDAAVYGRQENYSYADSIRTATEGIKNMLSRQVDNVGITKNLSVIMKEHGYIMSDLTDKVKGAGARHALYVGLLREAAAQQGDAARSLKTYTGAMASYESAQKSLAASVGDFVTLNASVGIALQAVARFLRWVTDELNNNQTGYKIVSDIIYYTIVAFSGFLKAINWVQIKLAEFDSDLRLQIKTFAEYVNNLVSLVIKVAEIAIKLPGASVAMMAMAKELGALYIIQNESNKVMMAQERIIDENNYNARRYSDTIGDLTGELDKLAKEVLASRGVIIQLGDVARPAGDKIKDALDDGSISAKELKKDLDALKHAFSLLLPAEKKHREEYRARIQAIMEAEQDIKLALYDLTKRPIPMLEGTLSSMKDFYTPLAKRQKEFFHELAEQMTELGKRLKDEAARLEAANPFGKTFKRAMADTFADLPLAMADAFARGESVAMAAGATVANAFANAYKKALERQAAAGGAFTASELLVGQISSAATGALAGATTGYQSGSKVKGILSGAATGAAAGMPLAAATGGMSVAIGAAAGGIAGLFGGIFGGKKKRAEELAEINKQKDALVAQYGSYANLKRVADDLGVSIDKTWNTKKLSEFTAGMDVLNKALADQQKRLAALGSAVEGVNKRAELLAAPFTALQETIKKAGEEGATAADKIAGDKAQAKMAETAQRSQKAFEMLGLVVRDTFAGLVKENGNAIDAITKLTPAFQTLEDGVEQFGLTSTAVIDELLINFKLVTDEALKPFFETIAADGKILQSLFDAKALSPEGFQAIAADIGASIQGIVDKGGDMSRTLALSQPVLQTLWEAQQRYGAITDETTAAILKQAEEQGLVGAAMKSVNEKILDVLLAIGKVLGADLPDYFSKLVPAAQSAATGVENALNAIEVDPITLKVQTEGMPGGGEIPELGGGGIATRRTLAFVGESGPEAIIPLSGSALGTNQGSYVTDIYLDGERIARNTAKRLPTVLRGIGVG